MLTAKSIALLPIGASTQHLLLGEAGQVLEGVEQQNFSHCCLLSTLHRCPSHAKTPWTSYNDKLGSRCHTGPTSKPLETTTRGQSGLPGLAMHLLGGPRVLNCWRLNLTLRIQDEAYVSRQNSRGDFPVANSLVRSSLAWKLPSLLHCTS